MIGLVLPGAVHDLLISLAATAPLGPRRFSFAVFLALYLVALGAVLRAVLLRVDLWLALLARAEGRAPGTPVHAIGIAGVMAIWLALVAGLSLVMAEAIVTFNALDGVQARFGEIALAVRVFLLP